MSESHRYPRKFTHKDGKFSDCDYVLIPSPGANWERWKNGRHLDTPGWLNCNEAGAVDDVKSGIWKECFDHFDQHPEWKGTAQDKRDREVLLRSIARELRERNRELEAENERLRKVIESKGTESIVKTLEFS